MQGAHPAKMRGQAEASSNGSGVWSLLRHHRRRFTVGLVLVVIAVGVQVLIPRTLQVGIDALQRNQPGGAIRAAWQLLAVVAVFVAFRFFSRSTIMDVARLVEYRVRRDVLDRLHLLGADFFRRYGTGEIMSRATADLQNVRMAYGLGLIGLVNILLTLVMTLAMMLAISWKLTTVLVVPLTLLVLNVRYLRRTTYKSGAEVQRQLGAMSRRVQENLSGVRVVRAYATEEYELATLDRLTQAFVRANLTLARHRSLSIPMMSVCVSTGLLLGLVYGGHLVGRGVLTMGQFVAMQGYFAMLVMPTLIAANLISILERARNSWERLREILDAVPAVADAGTRVLDRLPPGDLELSNVSFRYGERSVLEDVSFRVPRGGSVAIVGRTGSGKSTLAHVLPRLVPLSSGSVMVGGVDLTEVPLQALRRSIGYSPQDPFLFSTTIAANVSFGLEEPDAPDAMDRIRGACRAAHVDADILSFPDGYDTVVGERGVQLSGGQKQRVALARALVGKPDILVLDDPLSAVDAETERRILEAIDEISRDRTMVLVTHRCSAAQHADRIVVLDDGRIVEAGTHDELLARAGLYASFWRQQQLEADLDEIGSVGTGARAAT